MFATVPPELPAAGHLSYHRQVWQVHIVIQLVLLHPALGQVVDVGVGLRVFPLHQAVNRQQDIPSEGLDLLHGSQCCIFRHLRTPVPRSGQGQAGRCRRGEGREPHRAVWSLLLLPIKQHPTEWGCISPWLFPFSFSPQAQQHSHSAPAASWTARLRAQPAFATATQARAPWQAAAQAR